MRQPPGLLLVTVLACAALLAGCSNPASEDGESSTITTITDPNAGRTDPSMGEHLHDYWGGKHTLRVVDDVIPSGVTWFATTPISVATIRPEPGTVVPQGAGWVNITVSWVEDNSQVLPNRYEQPELWVKSAADNELVLRAEATDNPFTLAMPIGDAMADLPHQVLSGWQFDLYMLGTASTPGERWLQFSGEVTFTVTTDHTRNITLYPGHPDRWDGTTEIPLFSGGGSMSYTGDPTTNQWSCFNGCPIVHTPEDGVVVPWDADHVTVVIEQTNNPPFRMGLKFHGADTFEYTAPQASPDSMTSHTYVIPVGATGDGPYARQSQWEFVAYPAAPEENGFVIADYFMDATVYRTP